MKNVMPTYGRIDLSFERGEGPWLFTKDKKKYLDFATGIAVNTLGHSNKDLINTLAVQSKKLWHTSNLYNIKPQGELAELICENSFGESVFFCNSGAESLEGTIKLCRKFHFNNGDKNKTDILVCSSAFHGRTLGTLAAGDNDKHREGFGVNTNGFIRVPFGNIDEIKKFINKNTAAILVEPIQGEGGINRSPKGFLIKLRELCSENKILLALDEVQTGIGRTGKLFAHQWADIKPDVMAIAKGLGGGFPIGAVVSTYEAASGMSPGTHGSTFGGNFLASSVAKSVILQVTEDGFLDNVTKMGNKLSKAINLLSTEYPKHIKGVRGKGLMIGIVCNMSNADLCANLRENGLLSVPAGNNVLRLLPPLNINNEHADICIEILNNTLNNIKVK
ncbi:MAG: acetylornithine transaminase [Pelagibacterales bacterium]|nr:acetylornithine transaminase [Pelagibacterales bacterium]PPR15704.1 MAG: Acetylornithine aminotransferase [Alphaproteobacteria bacterium MarineAlpha9_Bin3]|tara:strand:- start:3202 stop:4374 length:1173 start_codon:yes stop_codon:yes gene_type:complete